MALSDFVRQNMSGTARSAAEALYQEGYQTADSDVITEELVADAFGQITGEGSVLEQFVRDNRTAGQKILDAVRDFLNRIRKALGKGGPDLTAEQRTTFKELEQKISDMERMLAGALERTMDAVTKNAGKDENGQKNTAHEGGRLNFSLKVIDNRVIPEIDIRNDTRDYGVAQQYLKTLISLDNPFSTILYDAQPVYIGKDLPGEYRGSKYTQGMRANLRTVKMQAATNLDEMVLLASGGEWRKNVKEKHKVDAKNGWYRYKTEFAIPVLNAEKKLSHHVIYGGVLLIRNDADGKSYLYDLIDLEKKKVISSSSSATVRKPDVFEPKPSSKSILQSEEKSNSEDSQKGKTKFSISMNNKGERISEAQDANSVHHSLKGMGELERQVTALEREKESSGNGWPTGRGRRSGQSR